MQSEMACAAEAAELLESVVEVSARITNCGLDPALLQLVKLHAAALSGCAACLEACVAEARAAGFDEGHIRMLHQWRRSNRVSARERAALGWAEAIRDGDDPSRIDAALQEVSRHFTAGEQLPLGMAILAIHRATCAHVAQVGEGRSAGEAAT